jgi:pimeloyl-[acyl-carrier protein] methyl ester esterase
MALAELDAFGAALLADPQATLLRFMSVQTRGMAAQKTLLQQLRQGLQAHPLATPQALSSGLAILRETDLRTALPQLRQPTLVIHGALDTLTPRDAGEWLASQLPAATWVELPRAAHAPQLSHVDAVYAALEVFLHD